MTTEKIKKTLKSLEKKKIIIVNNGLIKLIAKEIWAKDLNKKENQIVTKLLMG